MGLAPIEVDGVAAGVVGLADVAGVDEIPGRDGVTAAGDDPANGNGAGLGRLKADAGVALTATRDPPRAMKNTFSLGLLGGFHTMMSDPAV
jgi:hypothetical protein